MEEWRPVKGYEGLYEVSNLGRVKSLERDIVKSDGVIQHRSERIKEQTETPDGYLSVKLSADGTDCRRGVHRLVAEAFVDGWTEGAEVNHIDFDRKNNVPENLEWISHGDNVRYSISAGRHYCNRDLTGDKNPNYGNRKLSLIYMKNPEYAREKQSRPGAQNGRSTPVRLINPDGTYKDFEYIRRCAEYMISNGLTRGKLVDGVGAHISAAAKSGVLYLGRKFEMI